MDIPTEAMRGAPGPVLEDLRALDPTVCAISAYGRAKGLEGIASLRQLERLWLSGMSERHLSLLPPVLPIRDLVVHDYRSGSIQALPEAPALESLAVCGSAKLKSISGVERYRGLRQLILFDCNNYSDLLPLRPLEQLETLCLEGGFSKVLRVQSLEPLSSLRRLRRLRLASIRVKEGGLAPLEGLSSIESVFIARTFPRAELQRLARALPRARGRYLDDFRKAEAGS
jgi:hypothetical protein